MLINSGYQATNPDLDLSTQEWYTNAVDNYNQYCLSSSHVQHVIKDQRPWVITLSREVHNFYGTGNSDGVVFIDLNYSAISELCDQNSIGDKGYVFILDQNGNIVYHPSQQQLYNELQTENIDIVMNADTDTVVTGEGDDEKIYTLARSEITGWTIVGCMNMAELLKSSKEANNIYVMTAIVLVVIAMLISSFIARSITLPIQKLRDSMERVQEGDFKAADDLVIPSQNEIGSLTTSFNVMTHKIEDLMAQNVHEQELKRKSELKALQSQINPHFLYNTLDSLYFVAIMHGDDQMAEMVEALSDNFKLALNNGSKYIKVADSVKWMQGYMKLQNMRYNNRFELFVDISREILQRETITFIFQPFIENAMYHGLEPKIGKGKISLRGWQDNMIFTIEDDGVGIDDMSRLENGYGVRNVIERIKLNYGEKYGVTFESSPGNGTKVTIVVPVR